MLLISSARVPLHGQTQITGTLMDTASGKPLSGAEVFFFHEPTGQHSGKDGKFRLKGAAQDTILIFRRSGYVPIRTSLSEVSSGASADIGVLYLRPIAGDTDEVAVDAFDLLVYPQLASFYRRKRETPQAFFFTREQIERSGSRRVSEVLRRNRALQNICVKGKPHLTSTINSPGATMAAENQAAFIDCGEVAKRGTTYSGFRSGQMAPCALEAYLDGRRTELMVDDLDLRSVIAIEVYPLASVTPNELGAGRCGAVSVWTEDPKR